MTPTPEEVLESWVMQEDDGHIRCRMCGGRNGHHFDDDNQLCAALAASQERVRELEADNRKWRKIVNRYRLSILGDVLPESPA